MKSSIASTSKASEQEAGRAGRDLEWPFNLKSYNPEMTDGNAMVASLNDFAKRYLSRETTIRALYYTDMSLLEESVLQEYQSDSAPRTRSKCLHELLFINRFIMKPGVSGTPKDIKRLRISESSLINLLSCYEVSPVFIQALVSEGLATLPLECRSLIVEGRNLLNLWYSLPIRVEVECTESAKSHVLSTAGSSQMDPSQYLHLGDVSKDIRPSKITVHVQHDRKTHQTSAICIDFQDGRWWKLAEEPFLRTKETLQQWAKVKRQGEPFFIHLVLLTSVSRWWKNALARVNQQLIAHASLEKQLQQQTNSPADVGSTNETSKALHTMAAHLHRYKSETSIFSEVVSVLSSCSKCTCFSSHTGESHTTYASAMKVIGAEVKALQVSVDELERKTRTMLGLLYNNMQMLNDSLMVANGHSMRKILKATRAETRLSRRMAKQSQQVAVDMRKDSISMKTIAILTMFFLPGTSYAAILSMPFFTQQKWMENTSRIWLWVALTFPSTLLAFVVFLIFVRKGNRSIATAAGDDKDDGDLEMSGVVSDQES